MSENEVKQNEVLEETQAESPAEAIPEAKAPKESKSREIKAKEVEVDKQPTATAPAKKFRFAEAITEIHEADKQEIFAFLMSAQQQKLTVDATLYLFAEKIQYAMDKIK
ncbi:hypothetical protein [Leptospira levettii]|uniref:hypothetical protein n=1 Tax=Leptospira levettii TaxID=2023178 RepID=UPI000C2ABA2A|nr:hypothetical protein [Leptospira levettii]PJZ89524.1 hypothetical protein CH368_06080 [Leptospira levettii]